MKENILETQTGNIYYKTGGAGEPLFFIHGNGEDTSIFKGQLADFCRDYTIIAMDTRGHGQSDLGVDVLTFEQIAQDVIAIMDTLVIEQVTIVGYSDGGNIGMYLASHYPKRIKGLVMMGANYEVDALEEELLTKVKSYQKRLEGREQTPENVRKLNVLNLMLHELALTEEDLKRIKVPTLVMAGEFDIVAHSHTEAIAETIADSELFICPEGGHDFFVHQPALFLETVTLFLDKLKSDEK